MNGIPLVRRFVRGARGGMVSSLENGWKKSSLTKCRTIVATSVNCVEGVAVSGGIGVGHRPPRSWKEIWKELRTSPMQYATIPAVAAFLGLYTNYVGVKMLFYPIEYKGTEWCVFVPLFASLVFRPRFFDLALKCGVIASILTRTYRIGSYFICSRIPTQV